MPNDKNNVKERIKEALVRHPGGLTILDIARFTGFHRHTVTKYIYELLGAGVICQRSVSTAKLCYLKENFPEYKNKHSNFVIKGVISFWKAYRRKVYMKVWKRYKKPLTKV